MSKVEIRSVNLNGEVYVNANDLIRHIDEHKTWMRFELSRKGVYSIDFAAYALSHDHIASHIEEIEHKSL